MARSLYGFQNWTALLAARGGLLFSGRHTG